MVLLGFGKEIQGLIWVFVFVLQVVVLFRLGCSRAAAAEDPVWVSGFLFLELAAKQALHRERGRWQAEL
jgi:hypothetical protein